MKISNPEGAVRILRKTLAKMAREGEAQARTIKRLEGVRDRQAKQIAAIATDARDAVWSAGHLAAAIKDAIQAMVGSQPPTDDARELATALLECSRGTMRVVEQNNVEGAEQRERIRELEAAESARMLTLAEDNAIVNALSESRLGDMPVVEAVEKAIRAEALEPIVVTRPSVTLEPSPFLRGEARLMREYRPS